MKQVFFFCAIFLLFPMVAMSQGVDCIQFWDSQQQIIECEGEEPGQKDISYAREYLEIPIALRYTFQHDKLIAVSFFPLRKLDADGYYAEFLKIAGHLTEEFGRAEKKEAKGTEVMTWDTESSVIRLMFNGKWNLNMKAKPQEEKE